MVTIKSISEHPHDVFNDAGERLAARGWNVAVEIDGQDVDIEVRATDTAWASHHPELREWVAETLDRPLIDYESPISPARQLKAKSPLWMRVLSNG